MSGEITVYDRISDPSAFIDSFGTTIAKSQIFQCQNAEQGKVLAAECAARRCPPLTLAQRFHLIKGRLSMRADAIHADFRTSRPDRDSEVVLRTPDACQIKLIQNGRTYEFSLTWDDCQAEPFVYEGKESEVVAKLIAGKRDELKVKPKYITPRARMQMLWARLVSDSVRAVAPEVLVGHYTPEELGYEEEEIVTKPVPGEVVAEATVTVTPVEAEGNGQAKDPPFEDAKAEPVAVEPVADSDSATDKQLERIKGLVTDLRISGSEFKQSLEKRGIARVSEMTAEQADVMIANLEDLKNQTRVALSAPCSPKTAGRIKGLIGEMMQSDANVGDKIKEKMTAAGLQRITELSEGEAQELERALGIKNLEAFFQASLEGHAAKNLPG